jgi:hypothetical protein
METKNWEEDLGNLMLDGVSTQDIIDFIRNLLKETRDEGITAGMDLVKEKLDYYQDRVLYNREVIDLFA